jgi:hypothetical protein
MFIGYLLVSHDPLVLTLFWPSILRDGRRPYGYDEDRAVPSTTRVGLVEPRLLESLHPILHELYAVNTAVSSKLIREGGRIPGGIERSLAALRVADSHAPCLSAEP